jgi:hypothetical protein
MLSRVEVLMTPNVVTSLSFDKNHRLAPFPMPISHAEMLMIFKILPSILLCPHSFHMIVVYLRCSIDA